MLRDYVLAMKIYFIAKNSFSNELCSSLKLFNMPNDHVLTRKKHFVAKNSFSNEIYSSQKIVKIKKKIGG